MTRYGSDLVVDVLRGLGIRFAALNPGASFRGLHDSLVHGDGPEIILALSEGVAVSIAHGYVKATGEPMVAILHDLVGLQSGSMAIFNAYADRAPVLLIGGSGPADHSRRRPWIDWIHGPRGQGQLVRPFVKWDDEPASLAALPASLVRAHRLATMAPAGPTYVAVDVLLQESRLPASTVVPVPAPTPPSGLAAPTSDLEWVANLLRNALRPTIVADFVGRSRLAYESLIELAERLGAAVIDLGGSHNFPNNHWADRTTERREVLRDADVILALDVRDLQWATSELDHERHGSRPLVSREARIVAVGLNELRHRSFMDFEPLVSCESITADVAVVLPSLAEAVGEAVPGAEERRQRLRTSHSPPSVALNQVPSQGDLALARLAAATWSAIREGPWLLASGDLRGWARRLWTMDRWRSHLGSSGGAGLGYGLGASVGAALAHRDDDVLVVDLQPDGDFLYTASALWTAAHHRLPVLVVVVNNRTYGQDRMHQTLMARLRGRTRDLVHVGIDIDNPAVDFAALARAQGVEAWGPIEDDVSLDSALRIAARTVREERRPALVDVVVPR